MAWRFFRFQVVFAALSGVDFRHGKPVNQSWPVWLRGPHGTKFGLGVSPAGVEQCRGNGKTGLKSAGLAGAVGRSSGR
jgi:hypothetical protein